MTPTEKAKAKEQAKRYGKFIPPAPIVRKPRPGADKDPLRCIYIRSYRSGGVFYRVVIKREGVSYHAGSFKELDEAMRARDGWKAGLRGLGEKESREPTEWIGKSTCRVFGSRTVVIESEEYASVSFLEVVNG